MSFKAHRDMAKASRDSVLHRARGGQVSSTTEMSADEAPSMNKTRKSGGKVDAKIEGCDKPMRRASGGRTGKKATTVNVVIAGGGQPPQAAPMMAPHPMPVAAPAMAPRPPMPAPAAGMAPSPGVVPPGGMPHRHGGAVGRAKGGAVKMKFGSHSGEGRMEKAKMVEE